MMIRVIILHSPTWPIRAWHVTILQNETLTLIFSSPSITLHGSHRRLRPTQFYHLLSRRWNFAPAPFTNLHHLHHLHRAVHHGSAPGTCSTATGTMTKALAQRNNHHAQRHYRISFHLAPKTAPAGNAKQPLPPFSRTCRKHEPSAPEPRPPWKRPQASVPPYTLIPHYDAPTRATTWVREPAMAAKNAATLHLADTITTTPAHRSSSGRDSRSTKPANLTTAPSSKKNTSHSRAAKGETMEAETLVWKESALCHMSGCYWIVKLVNWSTLVNWSKAAVNFGQNCKNG